MFQVPRRKICVSHEFSSPHSDWQMVTAAMKLKDANATLVLRNLWWPFCPRHKTFGLNFRVCTICSQVTFLKLFPPTLLLAVIFQPDYYPAHFNPKWWFPHGSLLLSNVWPSSHVHMFKSCPAFKIYSNAPWSLQTEERFTFFEFHRTWNLPSMLITSWSVLQLFYEDKLSLFCKNFSSSEQDVSNASLCLL